MNRALRILLGIAGAAAGVYLLFEHIFPWVDRNLIADPTLDAAVTLFVG